MMKQHHRWLTACRLAWAAMLGVAVAGAASASTVSYTGGFKLDNDQFEVVFTLSSAASISARSFGFGGGTNAAGSAIAAGGLAPVMSLFAASGDVLQVVAGSTSTCAAATPDPATGFAWDPCFSTTLVAGTYALVLTQDDNLPLGPLRSDGFSRDADPDYTQLLAGSPTGHFFLVDGSQRTGNWAFDLTLPDPGTQALPLPGTGLLALAGLLPLAALRRRSGPTPSR